MACSATVTCFGFTAHPYDQSLSNRRNETLNELELCHSDWLASMPTSKHLVHLAHAHDLVLSEKQLDAIRSAAKQTENSLLIVISSPYFAQCNPLESFSAVQTYLSKLYSTAAVVLAQRDLLPLISVDVFISGLYYRDAASSSSTEERIWPPGLSLHDYVLHEPDSPGPEQGMANGTHSPSLHGTTAMGGTFDHLHAGHKVLLTMAAWISSKKVICGITDEPLLQRKSNKHLLESL